jgi:hypothetical protein
MSLASSQSTGVTQPEIMNRRIAAGSRGRNRTGIGGFIEWLLLLEKQNAPLIGETTNDASSEHGPCASDSEKAGNQSEQSRYQKD